MPFWMEATVLGLISGVVGTCGGGLLSFLLWRPREKLLSIILGFSAGIMLVIIFMELLPETFEIGGFKTGIAGFILGIILLFCLDVFFPHYHAFGTERAGRFRKAGVLLGIGIALHNVPEGLAIGAGYFANVELGLGLAVIMTVQNIPEGIAMATTMRIGNFRNITIIAATALAGLPMGLGAMAGALLGSISPQFLSISLGFAGGAMLYIVCDELIPEAHELAEGHSATLGIVVGVVLGIIILTL